MIYLDNAATTWPKPEAVYQAVSECLQGIAGSPGRGSHGKALTASYILYEAREELAELFNIDNPNNIAFALNATDAINMALVGLVKPGDRVVTTSMEHNAVARTLRYLETRGAQLCIIACDAAGRMDVGALEQALKDGARTIAVTHASNVTGTLMPLLEVGELAVKYDAVLMVDAAQTAGVEQIDVQKMRIDMLAFSGHKGLLGPQGTGGLYLREGIEVLPLRYGGTGSRSESDVQPDFMPDRLESGTPNTPGLAGVAAGVRFIKSVGQANIRQKEKQLAGQLLAGLKAINGVKTYGPKDMKERTAVVSFTIDGQDSGAVAHRLDKEFGIACRAGLHCAPWAHQTIGTLATGTVRFSPGYFNTSEEIIEAIQAVKSIRDC